MSISSQRTATFRLLSWAPNLILALLCGGVATAVEFAFGALIGPTAPFVAYFPAVVAAALLGGAVAGTLTILISIAVVWWAFMAPYYEFNPLSAVQVTNIALFTVSAFATVWIVYRYRQATFQRPRHD